METQQPGYFYEKLKNRLDELGASLNEASRLSGVARNRFNEWRRNERLPSDTELIRLSKVSRLGLTLGTLVGWRDLEDYGEDLMLEAVEEVCRLYPERAEEAMQKARQSRSGL